MSTDPRDWRRLPSPYGWDAEGLERKKRAIARVRAALEVARTPEDEEINEEDE